MILFSSCAFQFKVCHWAILGFTGLCFLAVAFVSMSSSSYRFMKLGYETLWMCKHALELML